MMYLENQSPFLAEQLLLNSADGTALVSVVVQTRLTHTSEKRWCLSATQPALPLEDEYYAEVGRSSLRLPSCVHPGKMASDILVLGDAIAIEGQVMQMQVRLQVGKLSYELAIFGDRYWDGKRISASLPFECMPLIYENAFGGEYRQTDQSVTTEARNPVGKGLYTKEQAASEHPIALPNIEHPESLITHPKDTPIPAGFGAIAPHWQPRIGYAGSYNEHWQKSRAPLPPEDFDVRFYNAAHPQLHYPGFLSGMESLEVSGMNASGVFACELPNINLQGEAWVMKEKVFFPFYLETLVVEPQESSVSLQWRGNVVCANPKTDVSKIIVRLQKPVSFSE